MHGPRSSAYSRASHKQILTKLRTCVPHRLPQGKFTTDGHSVSMSWYRAPLWDLRPDITSCCLKFAVLSLWGALSDERTGLSNSKLLYDSRSVRMSWYRAPLWDLRPDITSCCLKFPVLFLWGALSDERTGLCNSKLLYDSRSGSMSWYRAPL
jgi:hypothetical protein